MTRCKNHPLSMDVFNGTAQCHECGTLTYAQLMLCERCSKYLDQCEICRKAADTDINPALVAAFNSPVAQSARKLCQRGHKLQSEAYRDCLGQTYQGLVADYQEKLAAAIEPLKARLAEDLAADPAVQKTEAEVAAVRALPYSEENRRLHIEAMNAHSAAARPHDDAFRAAQAPLIAAYQTEIVPFESVHNALWQALQKSTQSLIDQGEATLTAVIDSARRNGR